jgi:Rv0078B-related antitoxin
MQPAADGLRIAIELTELGARLREQRYRREHPAATDDEVSAFMRQWWLDRPGAPNGDVAP